MIIFPTRASPISERLLLTMAMSPLNLVSSWVRTVFMDSVYSTGYFLTIYPRSYYLGKSARMVFTSLASIYSWESPFDYSLWEEHKSRDSKSRLV